ncbi:MAG: divalent-cation tolerance protein CutA [Opitutaceae bacterium]
MLIACTTIGTPGEAERLAAETIARGLAACVEISDVVSHYRWQGRQERSEELRLAFKCLESQLAALEGYVLAQHPYETPQWIVLKVERVSEKYLSWARAAGTTSTL